MNHPRFVVALADVKPGERKRVPVAMMGKWWKGKHKVVIDRQALSQMVENFRKRKADLMIDYEHASLAEPNGNPIPAAGWVKSLDEGPDDKGILFGEVEFTPRATEMIANREYKYFSPVIDWSIRDKATGEQQGATLTGLALTGRPFLEAMPVIALSDRSWVEISEKEATVKRVILTDRVAQTVLLVADDGTESEHHLEGAYKVLVLADVKRDRQGLMDFVASVPDDKDILISTEVFRAYQAQGELEAAIGKGLITPAQRPLYEKVALSDLDHFRAMVKTMLPVIDFKERGFSGDGSDVPESKRLSVEIEARTAAILSDHPGISHADATKVAFSESPDLQRRREFLRGVKG